MTLLPATPLGVRGHPGNAYDVNPVCSHPACGLPSRHAHHVWPRSFLRSQPYEWVKYPDGVIVGNRVGLCVEHHNQVTGEIGGYRAKIVWDGGLYWWFSALPGEPLGWQNVGMLTGGPPVYGLEHDHHVDGHAQLPAGDTCPTCGHTKTTSRDVAKPGKLRPTKTWTVTVPNDAEVGADLLDDWIDDFAIVFGMDEYSPRLKRYHVLMLLRAATLTQRHEIIAMVTEAAGRRLNR